MRWDILLSKPGNSLSYELECTISYKHVINQRNSFSKFLTFISIFYLKPSLQSSCIILH
ncbi:unnamed protein product [Moneuplotes crassus]|uniref:Uncharacterized protein n=1 Tax=Euplotes crassus TaxID=5936 RepID=A0AAD1Y747_EUPCR|nr:unnamed protein product [Moneuplotes crassus]